MGQLDLGANKVAYIDPNAIEKFPAGMIQLDWKNKVNPIGRVLFSSLSSLESDD